MGGIVVYFLLQYAKEKNELRKELNAVDDAQKSGSTGALHMYTRAAPPFYHRRSSARPALRNYMYGNAVQDGGWDQS